MSSQHLHLRADCPRAGAEPSTALGWGGHRKADRKGEKRLVLILSSFYVSLLEISTNSLGEGLF